MADYTVSIQPTALGNAPIPCADIDEHRLSVEYYNNLTPDDKTQMTGSSGAVDLYKGDTITFQYSDASGTGWWNDLAFSGLWFRKGADVSLLTVNTGQETSYSTTCSWGPHDKFFAPSGDTLKFTISSSPSEVEDLYFLIVGTYDNNGSSSSWDYDPEMCVDPITQVAVEPPLPKTRLSFRIHPAGERK